MALDTPQVNDGRRDIERAVTDLAERLPPPLRPLAQIAYNYRWAWFLHGSALFRDIDPAIWRRSECNPRYVIEAATPQRLQALAQEPAYVERVQRIAAAVDADLERPAADTPFSSARPIAYLCSEFGIHCS